jgi:Fe-S cluster assembly protein SufD
MNQTLDHYKQDFASTRDRRSQTEPAELVRAREDALNSFLALGFPTTRDEEWRFTSVAPIAGHSFVQAKASANAGHRSLARLAISGTAGAELVFVDGRFAPALSSIDDLPRGARLGSLADYIGSLAEESASLLAHVAPFDRRAFVAFNTAFFHDGAFIHIPANAVIEKPIHVVFVSSGETDGRRAAMSHPRVLAVLGDNSQAAIVESYAGPEGALYLTNVVTEIVLGNNAVLDHYKLQHESTEAYHVGGIFLKAARSANCASHSISLGGSLVRNDVVAVLDGEGGECALNGLYLADGHRLIDNHTTIDHAMPHCGSREMYKGILADRARGVFNGKIIVRPDAQKTDAKQTNRALLLSEDAQVNSKPELEIFANDVKCTHGAAVGQLDQDAVFYLRSRGLDLAEARHLLIHAFAGDVLNRMPLVPVRNGVEEVLQRQLAHALAAAA